MSVLKDNLGITCRNQIAWVVALENLQRAKIFHTYRRLDGLVQEKKHFLKHALLDKRRVLNSKCPEHFVWEGGQKRTV
jgi:hypothetical protein